MTPLAEKNGANFYSALLQDVHGELKGTERRWQAGPRTQSFAENRRFSQIHPFLGKSQMGGRNVSCDFGGGGGRTIERALHQTGFGGLRKWDWSGLCLFTLRKMTGVNKGGRSYHRWGCPKPFWGGVLWYAFPSLTFPPPLFFSDFFWKSSTRTAQETAENRRKPQETAD